MRTLVLGGTVFLGRAVVDEALTAGHEVTLLNRGLTNPVSDAHKTTLLGSVDLRVTARSLTIPLTVAWSGSGSARTGDLATEVRALRC